MASDAKVFVVRVYNRKGPGGGGAAGKPLSRNFICC